ncbi:MAG TPA: A24 family peptidase [Arenimonas sp.]|nr:A24 family peptidase [Arenimonas sp.]
MLAFFAEHSYFTLVLVFFLGLLVGSFLNVVILRLPPRLEWAWKQEAREVLALPEVYEPKPAGLAIERSACPKCSHQLSAWENIPLLSFLILRGKCKSCKTAISWQYPLVELITGVLFAFCIWRFGVSLQGGLALIFTAALIALSGIDLRTSLLPDQITQPLLWLGLIASLYTVFVDPVTALLGASIGYLSLWLVTRTFKLLTGKDGMGAGDFKLLAALGAWCGFKAILPIVFLSSIVGAIIGGIWLATAGKHKDTQIPFGQYLAIAGWIQFMSPVNFLTLYMNWATGG